MKATRRLLLRLEVLEDRWLLSAPSLALTQTLLPSLWQTVAPVLTPQPPPADQAGALAAQSVAAPAAAAAGSALTSAGQDGTAGAQAATGEATPNPPPDLLGSVVQTVTGTAADVVGSASSGAGITAADTSAGTVSATLGSTAGAATAPLPVVIGNVLGPVDAVVTGTVAAVAPVVDAVSNVAAPVVAVVGTVTAPLDPLVGAVAAPVDAVVQDVAAPVVDVVGTVAAPVVSVLDSTLAPVTVLVGDTVAAAAPVLSTTLSVVGNAVDAVAAPVQEVVEAVTTPLDSVTGSAAGGDTQGAVPPPVESGAGSTTVFVIPPVTPPPAVASTPPSPEGGSASGISTGDGQVVSSTPAPASPVVVPAPIQVAEQGGSPSPGPVVVPGGSPSTGAVAAPPAPGPSSPASQTALVTPGLPDVRLNPGVSSGGEAGDSALSPVLVGNSVAPGALSSLPVGPGFGLLPVEVGGEAVREGMATLPMTGLTPGPDAGGKDLLVVADSPEGQADRLSPGAVLGGEAAAFTGREINLFLPGLVDLAFGLDPSLAAGAPGLDPGSGLDDLAGPDASPQSLDLLVGAVPLDREALDHALRKFLQQIDELAGSVDQSPARVMGWTSALIGAAAAAGLYEFGYRRRRRRPEPTDPAPASEEEGASWYPGFPERDLS